MPRKSTTTQVFTQNSTCHIFHRLQILLGIKGLGKPRFQIRIIMSFLFVLGLVLATVQAHFLQLEPQMINPNTRKITITRKPWRNAGDTTFENPMPIGWTILTSQVVFAYLDASDVDYYTFTISRDNATIPPYETNDYEQAQTYFRAPNPVLRTSVLPPACAETVDNYPAVALIAKKGTASGIFAFNDVPFDIPEGYEAFSMTNLPPASGEQRVIYEIPKEGASKPLKLSWFLPEGCQLSPPGSPRPLNCTNSRTLTASILAEGETYYIAVWDPKGVAQDYSLNIGFDERFANGDPAIRRAIRNNKYLHTPCHPPYDK